MPPLSEKIVRYAVSLALAGLTVFLGYFAQRTDFVPFITAYGVFFAIYCRLAFYAQNTSGAALRWYVALGIALRILLLFSVPNLSDDFYRFLWDGHLTVAGVHPFAHPPVYFIENHVLPAAATPELFARLNSPEYFTVYPPVCQAVFALAAWAGKQDILTGVFVMKLFLLVCEMATIWLLGIQKRGGGIGGLGTGGLGEPGSVCKASAPDLPIPSPHSPLPNPLIPNPQSPLSNPQLLYALNPLIIFEVVGNCHFEGAMIFFLIAGLRALGQNKEKQAGLWWALATAAKLLPLMFLPIVLSRLGWRKGMVFSAVYGAVCLVLFAPLFSVLPNMLSSLDLYFQKFQFNASVYYLLGSIGFWIKGYDIGESLGPFLGLTTVAGVLAIAWKTKLSRFSNPGRFGTEEYLLFALMLQLSLSAAVHPWYATVPFALGLTTRWRFPVLWTGLVALSYSHYAGGAFQENYWLIALEYIVLWSFIFREFSPPGQKHQNRYKKD